MKSFFCNRVDSTNLEAKHILKSHKSKDPFWVIAHEQYAGRGHENNQWESNPGENFTSSLVIFPLKIAAFHQFQLSKLVSLGIKDFLELYLEGVKVKWPNDLYVGDRKIGGILIENEILGEFLSVSIIGIGVNINQLEFVSNAPNPVSLSQLLGCKMELTEAVKLLQSRVENRIESLSSSNNLVDEEYLKNLYRYKEFAPYKSHGNWFEARIIGIGEFGELILEEKSGKNRSFGFKEVEFILP